MRQTAFFHCINALINALAGKDLGNLIAQGVIIGRIVYSLLTICTMTPTLDTGLSCKMLSHSTCPIVFDNGVQKNGAARSKVDA